MVFFCLLFYLLNPLDKTYCCKKSLLEEKKSYCIAIKKQKIHLIFNLVIAVCFFFSKSFIYNRYPKTTFKKM